MKRPSLPASPPPAAPARARRRFFAVCAASLATLAVLALTPLRALAKSAAAEFSTRKLLKAESNDEAIAAYVDESSLSESEDVVINAPEIAENGNVVPIEVDATGVKGEVVQLAFFIANNPRPFNALYHFSGSAPVVSFRARMLESTQVTAVARLASGACLRNSADVKITTGGCGG